jgi:hypothetical protein
VTRISVAGNRLAYDAPVLRETPMHRIKLIGLVALAMVALATAASVIGRSYHPDLSATEEIQAGTVM